jgi:hypothetical protein
VTPETEELVARVLAKLEVELDLRARQRAARKAEQDYYRGVVDRLVALPQQQ